MNIFIFMFFLIISLIIFFIFTVLVMISYAKTAVVFLFDFLKNDFYQEDKGKTLKYFNKLKEHQDWNFKA